MFIFPNIERIHKRRGFASNRSERKIRSYLVVLVSLKAGTSSDLAISEPSSSAAGTYNRDLGFMRMGPI